LPPPPPPSCHVLPPSARRLRSLRPLPRSRPRGRKRGRGRRGRLLVSVGERTLARIIAPRRPHPTRHSCPPTLTLAPAALRTRRSPWPPCLSVELQGVLEQVRQGLRAAHATRQVRTQGWQRCGDGRACTRAMRAECDWVKLAGRHSLTRARAPLSHLRARSTVTALPHIIPGARHWQRAHDSRARGTLLPDQTPAFPLATQNRRGGGERSWSAHRPTHNAQWRDQAANSAVTTTANDWYSALMTAELSRSDEHQRAYANACSPWPGTP
jgi:hypothetical protein